MKMKKESYKTEERTREKLWKSSRLMKRVVWQERGTWMGSVGKEA